MKLTFMPKLVALAATAMALAGSALAYTGAIYTTWPDGTTTNGNVYDSKDHVYLNGGPQNANANGLPDGIYFFQVTDPSGKTLLSTDSAVNRRVMVFGGAVFGVGVYYSTSTGNTSYLGSTLPLSDHPEGAFNASNNSIGVKLMPYNDTPNAGGEYKAWLIPVDKATIGSDGIQLNFANNDAKTDNFKVRTDGGGGTEESFLTIFKFYDCNANGLLDPEDVPIPGFKFQLTYTDKNGGFHNGEIVYTDANGIVSLSVKPNTPYTAREFLPTTVGATWYESTPNANTGGDTFADGTGLYGFQGTTPGAGGQRDIEFGNYAMAPASGGLTLGFWSNKNGETKMTGSSIGQVLNGTANGALNGKNLVNASGALVAPFANYSVFRTWILSANATNMAYMLSAQLAAMELNVAFGNENGNTVVFVPASDSTGAGALIGQTLFNGDGFGHKANINQAVGGWTITINDLMSAAVTSLGANKVTVASGSVRTYQDALKTLIDQLNNNSIPGGGGFILPPIPPFSTPYLPAGGFYIDIPPTQ